jgi:hypothetical protein
MCLGDWWGLLVTCWVWVFTIFAFLPDIPSLALFGYPQAAPLPLHPLNLRYFCREYCCGLVGRWRGSLGVEKGATLGS